MPEAGNQQSGTATEHAGQVTFRVTNPADSKALDSANAASPSSSCSRLEVACIGLPSGQERKGRAAQVLVHWFGSLRPDQLTSKNPCQDFATADGSFSLERLQTRLAATTQFREPFLLH